MLLADKGCAELQTGSNPVPRANAHKRKYGMAEARTSASGTVDSGS